MGPSLDDGRDPQTYAIIGAAMEVHRQLGCGFLETAYQESLAIELRLREVLFLREVDIFIRYKGEQLNCTYRADFICYGDILVELKALKAITGIERSQVINYLKITGFHRALILNFGTPSLEYERIVY